MKVLICGDRHWGDPEPIKELLTLLQTTTNNQLLIITGGAPGADQTAERLCESLNIPNTIFYANWEKYGRRAGPIRNSVMIGTRPDIVIAFHNNVDSSKGTKNCIEQAQRKNIFTVIYGTNSVLDETKLYELLGLI